MTSNEPGHMWRHWRDKYGIKTALEDYFPQTVKNDPRLQHAITMIEAGEALIEKIMKEKQEAEDDDGS